MKRLVFIYIAYLITSCAGVSTTSNLIDASVSNDTKKMERYLEAGVNPNKLTRKGDSALMWAAWYGNIDAARMLIKHGANINLQSKFGDTPLMWAVMNEKQEMVEQLIDLGADVNIVTYFNISALMEAAATGNKKLIKTLLSYGADPFRVDKGGFDAIGWAKRAKKNEVIYLIKEAKESAKFAKYKPNKLIAVVKKKGSKYKPSKKLAKKGDRFKSLITSFNGKTVLYVYADYCPPCRVMEPHLDRFEKEYKHIQLIRVNIQKYKKRYSYTDQKMIVSLLKEHNLVGVPAMLLMHSEVGKIKIISIKNKTMLYDDLVKWLSAYSK